MQIIEGIQGGEVLEIPVDEYALASRAILIGAAQEISTGIAYMPTDLDSVGYAVEGEKLDSPAPEQDDILAAARGIARILGDAWLINSHRQVDGEFSKMYHAHLPDGVKELMTGMDAILRTGKTAASLGFSPRATEFAERGSIVISEGVTVYAMDGLRRIAATHTFFGGLKSGMNIARTVFGMHPRNKPLPLPRESRDIRDAAVAALESMQ